MNDSTSKSFAALAMYRKSRSLFQLARKIADYITDHKSALEMHASKNPADKYADALVMYTMHLPTEIAALDSKLNGTQNHGNYKRLYSFEERIKKTCNLLIETKIAGHEFVVLLRDELLQFQKLSRSYGKSS